MDIKLKKSRLYKRHMKTAAVLFIFLFTIVFFSGGVVFYKISQNWQESPFDAENYFETDLFRYRFNNLLDKVVNVTLHYKSEGNIEDGNAIDRESLITSFKEYYSIVDGTITDSTSINDTYDGLVVLRSIPNELMDNFIEYQELVEKRLPQYKKIYIQSQLADFKSQKEEILYYNNFYYYVEDESGVKIGSNAQKDFILSLERNIVAEGSFSTNRISENFGGYQNPLLAEGNEKIYAGISDTLAPPDIFYYENADFIFYKNITPVILGAMLFSLIMEFILFIYLIYVAGQNEKGGPIELKMVDRIFNDVHVFLVLIGSFLSLFGITIIIDGMYYNAGNFWDYFTVALLGIVVVMDTGMYLSFILSMSRQIKAKRLFHNTFVSAAIRRIGMLFSGKVFRGWMVLLMLVYGFMNAGFAMVLFIVLNYSLSQAMIVLVVMMIFNGMSVFLFVRALSSLTKIMIAAKETGAGNLNNKLELSKISPSFLNFAKDIAGIQSGLKTAVEEAVKGERMKAELITNVSHDLKTPLTSIVTYVDLLKKENIENERVQNYVSVLDEKSARLKQLIEDLIEASKASSGNLTVTKQKVDLRQLVMQASGELEEKIESAGLNFRINSQGETCVLADGRHMWRIVENLLSNAIKYSMPNSRVYIDIIKSEKMGVLIIKNISEMPIEVTAEQLTERFVRGDESRTTEGSGLGLSIAKSLTSLQGGLFSINIDGDLFKATIRMPLWTEEEQGNEQNNEPPSNQDIGLNNEPKEVIV